MERWEESDTSMQEGHEELSERIDEEIEEENRDQDES